MRYHLRCKYKHKYKLYGQGEYDETGLILNNIRIISPYLNEKFDDMCIS